MKRAPHYAAGEPLEAGKLLWWASCGMGKMRLFHSAGPGRKKLGFVTTRDYREDEVIPEATLHATEDL